MVFVGVDRMFEVRVINDRGLTPRKFTYGDLQQARRTAADWTISTGGTHTRWIDD
jgi:hypothetical protein